MSQNVAICLSSVRGKIARPPREISTTGHLPTSCCLCPTCMLPQVAASCHNLPQVAKSCCPCPTCMFTGTAVLPAYLHNPVFPDGVSEGSPHKLPLLLIRILSPQTGSVRLICCIARQPNHVYLSPSAAPRTLQKINFEEMSRLCRKHALCSICFADMYLR